MKEKTKKLIIYSLLLLLVIGALLYINKDQLKPSGPAAQGGIDEDGAYYSAAEVAEYLTEYGHLPKNYVTKEEAKAAGWTGGSLDPYIDGAAIGGESFGNKEKLLPEKSGRQYFVCDIDTKGKDDRGEKRLVYSNDGLIYYTEDYFRSFTLLYGDAEDKPASDPQNSGQGEESSLSVKESGSYFDKDHVALYIHEFGHLPGNYVTKKEAEKAGWSGGSVQKYLPGKAIGGDRFGNNEGLLPSKSGRTYYECDIDTDGKSSRGAKRIIFSNDGLVYYTDDHYEHFTLLYGED